MLNEKIKTVWWKSTLLFVESYFSFTSLVALIVLSAGQSSADIGHNAI